MTRFEAISFVSSIFRWGALGGCLLSSFHLFRIRYVRYLMAFWWIFFVRILMVGFKMMMLLSFWEECSCIVPHPPVVMVRGKLIFHPLSMRIFSSGSYLVCVCLMACFGNLPW